jgi:hypothetical protein
LLKSDGNKDIQQIIQARLEVEGGGATTAAANHQRAWNSAVVNM